MTLVSKSFSEIVTFSRSSNATRVGPTGLVEYAPHNLAQRSQEFDNAYWNKDRLSVTANTTAAPDGTITADTLTATNSSADLYVATNSGAGTYTQSFYVKRKTGTGQIQFVTADGGRTNVTQTISSSEWTRITYTETTTLSNTYIGLRIVTSGDELYVWGAQQVRGPYALDYTPTTSAAVYGPRFDYNGSGVTIVEPVSTNQFLYSEQFDNAWWPKGNASITANASVAPDGTTTADKLVENSSNAFHYVGRTSISVSAQAYTASFYAKAVERTRCFIDFNDGITGAVAYFNLADGTSSNVSATLTVSISSVGNGWYRITASRVYASATSGAQFTISPTIAAGTTTYLGDGTSGILIWGAQLEVGSTATGYMVSGATNGFRAVPVVSGSATARGLLVEEQRTNLILQSNVGNIGTNWQQYGTAVLTQNYSAAPDGTVSAGRLAVTTSGIVRVVSSSLTNGTTYAASIWMKSNTASSYSIDIQIGDNFIGTFTITPTWQRFSGAGTPLVTGYNFIDLESFNNLDISVWGAQIEQGGFATSLIPTSGSTVTRSADVASVNTLSPWFNATEGTIYTESVSQANNRIAWFRNSATGTYVDFISSRLNNLFQGNSDVYVSGSLQSTVTTANAVNSSTLARIAAAYKANDFAISLNGGTVVTDTSGTIPAVNRLQIGWHDDGLYLNGHILRLAYYPRKLSSAELQALSA